MKASIRREGHQRRLREKAHQRGIDTSYLEDDYEDDDQEVSISAIKKQYKPGAKVKGQLEGDYLPLQKITTL